MSTRNLHISWKEYILQVDCYMNTDFAGRWNNEYNQNPHYVTSQTKSHDDATVYFLLAHNDLLPSYNAIQVTAVSDLSFQLSNLNFSDATNYETKAGTNAKKHNILPIKFSYFTVEFFERHPTCGSTLTAKISHYELETNAIQTAAVAPLTVSRARFKIQYPFLQDFTPETNLRIQNLNSDFPHAISCGQMKYNSIFHLDIDKGALLSGPTLFVLMQGLHDTSYCHHPTLYNAFGYVSAQIPYSISSWRTAPPIYLPAHEYNAAADKEPFILSLLTIILLFESNHEDFSMELEQLQSKSAHIAIKNFAVLNWITSIVRHKQFCRQMNFITGSFITDYEYRQDLTFRRFCNSVYSSLY
eukprot:scaffold1928_cov165-Chaetoceros_neogracile.AAC.1